MKPRNILIRPDGRPTLVDFGSVRLSRAGTMTVTQAKGTLGYMAPEQIVPGAPLDERADVYSLGMTAYALLLGSFRQPGEPAAVVLERCRTRLAVATDPPCTAEDLGRVLARATALDPEAHYPTAAAPLADDLERLASGVKLPRERRPERLWQGLLVVVLLAVAGAAIWGWVVWHRGTNYRIDPEQGVIFLNAFGAPIATEPLVPLGLAEASYHRTRSQDLLAVTPLQYEERSGMQLFDVRAAAPLPGWEEPFFLTRETAPATWDPFDPYDPEASSTALRKPAIVDIDGDGQDEVFVQAKNLLWATEHLVRITRNREIRAAYSQFGFFEVDLWHDVNGDGLLDAICHGVNNYVKTERLPASKNLKVVFAISGAALMADSSPRFEGPPGRLERRGAWDSEAILFYQVLRPGFYDGQFHEWQPAAVSLQEEEERFAWPLSLQVADLPEPISFILFLDTNGGFLSLRPSWGWEGLERDHPGKVEVKEPVAFVLDGEVQHPVGRFIEEMDGNHRIQRFWLAEQ